MIQEYDHFYIVIDSLDECGDRLELLAWIRSMASWKSNWLHLLLTSRLETDIMDNLNTVSGLAYVRWNEENIRIIETPTSDDTGAGNILNVLKRAERSDRSQYTSGECIFVCLPACLFRLDRPLT